MRRPFALLAGVAVVVAATVLFVATRERSKAPESTNCFLLSLTPTPVSGGSFKASVRPRSGCEDPGELLGGPVLELRERDRKVAFLEAPDRVLPPDSASTTGGGQRVDLPRPFKLPELSEGRYTLCSTFSTASTTNEQVCAVFDVAD